ncbi:MAG: DUF3288 family protein [Coleofasciculaceae cyanobacterium]
MLDNKDQQHPQEKIDRAIIESLRREGSNNYNLAQLARLRIRYNRFPGARDIKQNLDALLAQWQMTEEQLFATTRHLYEAGQVYKPESAEKQDDWS